MGKVDNKDKNIRENVSNHVSTWPDETAGSSWIVKRSDSSGNVDGKTYFKLYFGFYLERL